MRKQARYLPALLLVVASTVGAASPAFATPITYTESDIASGSLGGVAFSNANIVLTESSDTLDVFFNGIGFVNIGTLMVSVNGGPSVTFTDTTGAVSNQNLPGVGVSDFTKDLAILFDVSSSFSTYDLRTSIGPITGSPELNPGQSFSTTGGAFILNTVGNPTFTATATSFAVPEPNSLAIFASAVAGLGFLFHRRPRAP